MVNHDYAMNFLLKLMTRDLNYAQIEAANCGVDLKTAEIARGLFESAIAKGFDEKDMASVIESLRAK
jgi:3-hydroxyisobutyrate dehydrogenase